MISQLGRYEVTDELGQGAMGVVYRAKDPLIDRVVAIKTINLSLAKEEKDEYEGRFYQEARAAGRLNHPNIVTIYDVGKSGDIAYIAMEMLQGRELRDIMNDGTLIPVDQVLDIAAQVALGLNYAHEHDIVHRDVKPSNIMVIRDGHVKITDFGIARMASAAVRTQTGMVLGSPKYMSPEQVMGRTIDARSDIFSLGVMIYEMLTGQPPFNGDNVNTIMYQTLNGTPLPPNEINPAVPEMLNFILVKALAKSLDDRYQSAKELADDLRACRDTLPRTPKKLNTTSTGEKRLPPTVSATGRIWTDEESFKTASQARMSPAFDSTAATMRLAALTSSEEDVDELSKTLKISRPSPESPKTELPKPSPTKPIAPKPSPAPNPKLITTPRPMQPMVKPKSHAPMIVIIIVILLGIAAFKLL
ncbi:MAG: protein kinase [Gallionella sp.]|nr:protein kinase [Gallionella sp.]MDD4959483.1 protein kinase [Gallionella sp.]